MFCSDTPSTTLPSKPPKPSALANNTAFTLSSLSDHAINTFPFFSRNYPTKNAALLCKLAVVYLKMLTFRLFKRIWWLFEAVVCSLPPVYLELMNSLSLFQGSWTFI